MRPPSPQHVCSSAGQSKQRRHVERDVGIRRAAPPAAHIHIHRGAHARGKRCAVALPSRAGACTSTPSRPTRAEGMEAREDGRARQSARQERHTTTTRPLRTNVWSRLLSPCCALGFPNRELCCGRRSGARDAGLRRNATHAYGEERRASMYMNGPPQLSGLGPRPTSCHGPPTPSAGVWMREKGGRGGESARARAHGAPGTGDTRKRWRGERGGGSAVSGPVPRHSHPPGPPSPPLTNTHTHV